ncbi:hypothetical protein EDC04DRAFT_3145268 [Pisolithus marmoratus]|nr:hypothetical protein EDC04DRAFT_3145268 [Pisolithus marmoratus]
MNLVRAPDEDSQHASDKIKESQALPGLSSKALEPEGDLPDTTSKRAETKTGHTRPKAEVVDTRQMVDILSMFKIRTTGRTQLDKHASAPEAPDEGSQHAESKVAECRNSPELTSEAPEPADNTAGPTSGHSMEDVPQTTVEENQRTWTNSETIAEVPDPLGMHAELPVPYSEHPIPQDKPPAWVHRHSRTGKVNSTDVESTTMKLEIRATSAQMVDTRAHVGRRPKEPDKAEDTSGGGDDTASKEFVDSHGAEKVLLSDRECQHSERETKWPDHLPAPHGLPPNGLMHTPKMSRVPHRHSRGNTNPVNGSGLQTRGYRCLILSGPISLPCKVLQHV